MNRRVKILNTQSGDWVGIFVDGKIIFQGHDINVISVLRWSEEYDFGYRDVEFKEINDKDEEYMYKAGRFPDSIKDLNGEY
jgi:hypothetical protein